MPAVPGQSMLAARGQRDPSLLVDAPQQRPDQVSHNSPVPDHIANDSDGPGAEASLIHAGELLTTGTTLAVRLPGDDTESWFSAKHTAVAQPGETDNDIVTRSVTLVNETCYASIKDVMEIMAENEAEAAAAQAQA